MCALLGSAVVFYPEIGPKGADEKAEIFNGVKGEMTK